ncbi:kynurenine--oxoglutarate transaminase [Ascoidea rubescens DSM 1968]|uniref:Kynurenine aminotransferase n=1 Tax=Ascoidea rubescens DSM 1968 TaxID=1344418 RepID=A0A1D2VBN7_9ASCO|nr:kynurenine aminotransferase [Ascoidea rubescens DSM 1968]ODV58893.1 kynurenine aminotransferase [Ascoidea rubescens DSM 1968]
MTLPIHNKYFGNTPKDVWSLINETAAAAEQETGKKVINLGQGFFSYSPPEFAIKAAQEALLDPMANQYSHTKGRPVLLNSLSKYYSKKFNRNVPIDEILVTAGANEGMLTAFTGFLNPGDEVIVFEPFFDQYISNIEMPGGKVVYVPLHPPESFKDKTIDGSDWKIDYDQLEKAITKKTKMIVVNTPQNPVGKVFTEEELTKIGNLAVKYNIIILSDEVYENLYYGDNFPRFATLTPEIAKQTITVGSAGKSFAATGWRIGWLIADPYYIKYCGLAHTRICFTTNSPLQVAVSKAIDYASNSDYFEKTRSEFKKKYEIFTKVFDDLGLPYTRAEGSYYILVNFNKVKIPSDYKFPEELSDKAKDFKAAYWLIREIGVVAIPPTEFYIKEHEHVAEDCLRFAVCKEDCVLEQAVERLKKLAEYL